MYKRIKKFVAIFIFSICFASLAKARLEYNPLMDWYYWVEETESETYRYMARCIIKMVM